MRAFIESFCKENEYPPEASIDLLKAYDKMEGDTVLSEILNKAIVEYELSEHLEFQKILDEIEARCEEINLCYYAPHLLLFICLSKELKQKYKKAGYTDKMFNGVMLDLKCKLIECKNVKNVWGSFVAFWFPWFYTLKRFALGRLQYEIIDFYTNYSRAGVNLTSGSKVLNIHIPSQGPLIIEDVHNSYTEAEQFFKSEFNNGIVPIVCHSWLLYPKLKEMLKPTSNIIKFISDFDIFESVEDEEFNDCWRIFNVRFDGDVEKLPKDNSIRLAFYNHLKNGGKAGQGKGVILIKDSIIIK